MFCSLGIGAVAFSSHLIAFKCAVLLTNSDFSILAMLAQDFLHGHFWIMPPAQHFGGMTMTLVRAFWLMIASIWPGKTILDPWTNLAFTYLILPTAVALLGYTLARQLFTSGIALIVGLLYAIGFAGWIQMYGNDFYWGAIVLGFIALIWRSKSLKPWHDFSPFQLGLAGFLVGISAYTWRGALPITLTLLIPTSRNEFPVTHELFKKIRYCIWGGVIGFLPEIYYLMNNSVPDGISGHGDWAMPHEVFLNLRKLPFAFKEIVSGSEMDWKRSLSHLSIPLFLSSLVAMLWRSSLEKKLRPAVLSIVLTIVSFLSVNTYASGPWRYLLPMTPALMLSVGAFLTKFRNSKFKYFSIVLVVSLLILHLFNQFSFRTMLMAENRKTNREQLINEVILQFKKRVIRVVISDDYWNTNTFTLMSGREILFVSPIRRYAPKESYALLESEKHIGFLISKFVDKEIQTRKIQYRGLDFPFYTRVQNLGLFIK